MGVKFANNAESTLLAGITALATTCNVQAGHGARFPVLAAGDYFYATLVNASVEIEIVKVTARVGDQFTIERAQQGTAARAYSANDPIGLFLTATSLDNFPKKDEDNAYTGKQKFGSKVTVQSAFNYAEASAVGDDYSLTLDPAPSAIADGMPIHFKAPSANTTATPTLAVNTLGPYVITKNGGQPLRPGDIPANGAVTVIKVTISATNYYELQNTPAQTQKPLVKDHGIKGANYTIDLSEAEMHLVAFTAPATLSINSSYTNDKAIVVIKNGNNAIALSGIDNDSPTLTTAANAQDFLALVKSFGKISCVSGVYNRTAV